MFFKSMLFYRLPAGFYMTAQALEDELGRRPLNPPSEATMESVGWSAAGPDGQLVYGVERNLLVTLGQAKRVLPSSVVKREVEERAAKLADQQGFPPGRKQLKDLKDAVINELRPRAFIKYSFIRAWIDLTGGFLVVDTTSAKKAETLIALMIGTIESGLGVTPVNVRIRPGDEMTRWLLNSAVPEGFEVTYESELIVPDGDGKATVRYLRHQVEGRGDVIQHLKDGKTVSKLGLQFNGAVHFTLTDSLQICKLAFNAVEEGDRITDFDTDFTLMATEYRRLILALLEVFGEVKEASHPAAAGDEEEETDRFADGDIVSASDVSAQSGGSSGTSAARAGNDGEEVAADESRQPEDALA